MISQSPLRSLLLVIAVAMLAGCASTPRPKDARAPSAAPTELYAGEPPAVHGTEYPVTSGADGVERGNAAWKEGKLELALYLYVQALAFDPKDADTLRKIGALHESRGNRALARRAFEMALTQGGPHAATMERLGLLYIHDGENDPAQTLLTRAVALDGDRWRAYDGLGVLADRRKQYGVAQAHYDMALRIEPRAATVYNNRGYSKFLRGDLKGAQADLSEALALSPSPRAWINLGKVQAKSRQYGTAFKTFLEVLDTAHAYNAVGEGAMSNGDHQIAKTYFENATTASPSYFEEAQKNLTLANEALAGRGPGSGS
jgi:tetratricopeptide (TPR) repeat protein